MPTITLASSEVEGLKFSRRRNLDLVSWLWYQLDMYVVANVFEELAASTVKVKL
jgi:hypothetical protein